MRGLLTGAPAASAKRSRSTTSRAAAQAFVAFGTCTAALWPLSNGAAARAAARLAPCRRSPMAVAPVLRS